MPPLRFIGPATGSEVDTGIDLDGQSFAACRVTSPHSVAAIATSRTCVRVSKRGSANSNPTTSKPQE
jgi:hypothetical protein